VFEENSRRVRRNSALKADHDEDIEKVLASIPSNPFTQKQSVMASCHPLGEASSFASLMDFLIHTATVLKRARTMPALLSRVLQHRSQEIEVTDGIRIRRLF
jgi:hypothetical protein